MIETGIARDIAFRSWLGEAVQAYFRAGRVHDGGAMRPETALWWRQAQADHETARYNFAGCQYYAASWFVQQAVEKGLKALYIEREGVLAPRTHNLEELGRRLHVPSSVVDDLKEINPTLLLARYPDMSEGLAPVDAVSEDDAAQLLSSADRVMTWLYEQLNPPSNQS